MVFKQNFTSPDWVTLISRDYTDKIYIYLLQQLKKTKAVENSLMNNLKSHSQFKEEDRHKVVDLLQWWFADEHEVFIIYSWSFALSFLSPAFSMGPNLRRHLSNIRALLFYNGGVCSTSRNSIFSVFSNIPKIISLADGRKFRKMYGGRTRGIIPPPCSSRQVYKYSLEYCGLNTKNKIQKTKL